MKMGVNIAKNKKDIVKDVLKYCMASSFLSVSIFTVKKRDTIELNDNVRMSIILRKLLQRGTKPYAERPVSLPYARVILFIIYGTNQN